MPAVTIDAPANSTAPGSRTRGSAASRKSSPYTNPRSGRRSTARTIATAAARTSRERRDHLRRTALRVAGRGRDHEPGEDVGQGVDDQRQARGDGVETDAGRHHEGGQNGTSSRAVTWVARATPWPRTPTTGSYLGEGDPAWPRPPAGSPERGRRTARCPCDGGPDARGLDGERVQGPQQSQAGGDQCHVREAEAVVEEEVVAPSSTPQASSSATPRGMVNTNQRPMAIASSPSVAKITGSSA